MKTKTYSHAESFKRESKMGQVIVKREWDYEGLKDYEVVCVNEMELDRKSKVWYGRRFFTLIVDERDLNQD